MGFGGVRQSVCMVIVEQFSRSAKYKDDMTCNSPQFSLVLLVFLDELGPVECVPSHSNGNRFTV